MRNIELVTVKSFTGKRLTNILSNNADTIIVSACNQLACSQIDVKSIEAYPGNYRIFFFIETCAPLYFLSYHGRYRKIPLNKPLTNGINMLDITVPSNQKYPFDFSIYSINAGTTYKISFFRIINADKPVPEHINQHINNLIKPQISTSITSISNLDNRDKNDVIIVPIKNNQYNGTKISIAMSYINRRAQLETTLKTIKNSAYKNVEIVINDDGSTIDEQIDDFVEKYGIVLIKTNPLTKKNNSPVIGYNKAISKTTGDIIIVQNPEVCHMGDIISHVAAEITNSNYYSYSCMALTNFEENKTLQILLSENKYIDAKQLSDRIGISRWYNHPSEVPTYFHFCCALSRDNMLRLKGFNLDFANGFCFDDDDFVARIKYDLKLDMKIIPPLLYYTIHQYHLPSGATNCDSFSPSDARRIAWDRNRNLHDKSLKKKIDNSTANRIPKIFHSYWNGSPLSYLTYLSILSFRYYNPDWLIKIHTPVKRFDRKSWDSEENVCDYDGPDYWRDLVEIPNLSVNKVKFEEIGFGNDAPEIAKSNFLRWHILSTEGGLWSDMDILYINSVNNTIFEKVLNFNAYTCIAQEKDDPYPTGFYLAAPCSLFFQKIKNSVYDYYDSDNPQSIGSSLVKKIYPNHQKINVNNPELQVIIADKVLYMPYNRSELHNIFEKINYDAIKENTIGIQWYNDSLTAKLFQKNFDEHLQKECTLSILIRKFIELIKKDHYLYPIEILNPKIKTP